MGPGKEKERGGERGKNRDWVDLSGELVGSEKKVSIDHAVSLEV